MNRLSNLLTPWDGVMYVLLLAVLVPLALYIRRARYRNDPSGRYLVPGLLVKIAGGTLLGLVYQFYYSAGDTTGYFINASSLLQLLLENPADGWALVNANFSQLDFETLALYEKYRTRYWLVYWNDTNSYNVSRYILPFVALGLNTYYGTAVLVAAFSFIGVWLLYRVFVYYYPEISGRLAIAILFIPSVFFWGSGILKDSLTLGAVGLLVYGCHWLLRSRFRSLPAIAMTIYAAFFIYQIKPYVSLSLIPFLAIWVGLTLRQHLRNGLLRFVLVPVIGAIVVVAGYLALTFASISSSRYQTERILNSVVEIKRDLTSTYYYADGRGSAYNIGEFDENFLSQVRLFFPAVGTAYFRPFIWEVRNVLMFFASLESTIILILFVSLLFRTGLFNLLLLVSRTPFLLLCLGYSVFFGYIIGLTSGNFGNLVRFKTPSLPFFLAGLFIADHLIRVYRRQRFERLHPPNLPPSLNPDTSTAVTST
jgi:hypothetical protein